MNKLSKSGIITAKDTTLLRVKTKDKLSTLVHQGKTYLIDIDTFFAFEVMQDNKPVTIVEIHGNIPN